MPGLYKPSDRLRHDYQDAIQAQAGAAKFNSPWGPPPSNPPPSVRPMGVVVISEVAPGSYQCQTTMGLVIVIDELRLTPIPGIPIAGPGPLGIPLGPPPD